ncbi:hypothetical protein Krac_6289 [Ktedonobacter racemifer DSM 44963]|uniref:Uncharacterized protein n=2 Tax=Ktedonobacter racemifer TaxID=363277 RepID=D6TYQ4_KTERA|nr:hypothetical protein Krac_6289 [Ktedonobacter racemifer DSM 44963]
MSNHTIEMEPMTTCVNESNILLPRFLRVPTLPKFGILLFVEFLPPKKRFLELCLSIALDMASSEVVSSARSHVLRTPALFLLEKCSHFFFGKTISWTFIGWPWLLSRVTNSCFGDQASGKPEGETERGIIDYV